MRSYSIAIFTISVLTSSLYAQMGDNEGELQPDLPSHIMNMESPVLSTEEAIRSFQLQEGFEIQLVASEPMIEDPVACVFAPDGSLWVIEMQSYMPDVDGNNEDLPISRVVRLVDVNSDGIMDESTVFLDKLVLIFGYFFENSKFSLILFIFFIIILYTHKENIVRLKNSKENKIKL